MTLVTKAERTTITVAVNITIDDRHVRFAQEVLHSMGAVAAIKYLYHVYPDIPLNVCKEIVEKYISK